MTATSFCQLDILHFTIHDIYIFYEIMNIIKTIVKINLTKSRKMKEIKSVLQTIVTSPIKLMNTNKIVFIIHKVFITFSMHFLYIVI